jgi:tRNA pseudouridine38-40 synthase
MTIECESKVEASIVDNNDEMSSTALKSIVKRKVAVLCGFNGSKYQGMQMNHKAHTIEGELFSAMCHTGLISPTNSVDPKKISWMRACRTDKGVHAAGQVISMKMEMMDGVEVLRDKLNDALPQDIRVFGILEAAGSFHSKERCDSRVYEYVMPTYVFAPVNRDAFFAFSGKKGEQNDQSVVDDAQSNSGAGSKKVKYSEESDEEEGEEIEMDSKDSDFFTEFIPTEQEEAAIRAFRLTKEQLERIESLLKCYRGTHPFHNFTPRKTIKDPSAQRYIRDTRIYNPFCQDSTLFYQPDGTEWMAIQIHGNSFMLHQIRKMIGMIIWALRLDSKTDVIRQAFQDTKLNVPKAPSLGLFLDRAIFDGYNKRFTGQRHPIDFETEPFLTMRTRLKTDTIYPTIFETEAKERVFYKWCRCLELHSYDLKYFI